ncbi:MAG: agmatinase [Pseudomonadota bacterium]
MTDSSQNEIFLGADAQDVGIENSKVAILSAPFEATVSYGSGTSKGPRSIIEASSQVELYDEELDLEPYRVGIYTHPTIDFDGLSVEASLERIGNSVSELIKSGKKVLMLGGEHSVTAPSVKAHHEVHPEFTVLQFDAHADLKEEYQGSPHSHASVMARVREMVPAVQVGMRSLNADEARIIKAKEYPLFYAYAIRKNKNWIQDVIKSIRTKKVYVTLDIDVFSSSIMPATGTPEPGGLDWYEVTALLKEVGEKFDVIGADLVELAPIDGLIATDFLAAKLAYKMIGYFWATNSK